MHGQGLAWAATVEFMPNPSSDGEVTRGPLGTSHELTADAASMRVGLEWRPLWQLPVRVAQMDRGAMNGGTVWSSVRNETGDRTGHGCAGARLGTAAGQYA